MPDFCKRIRDAKQDRERERGGEGTSKSKNCKWAVSHGYVAIDESRDSARPLDSYKIFMLLEKIPKMNWTTSSRDKNQ